MRPPADLRAARRPALTLADRFTGGERRLDDSNARAFALITIANELDVVRNANLPAATVGAIARLLAALSPNAPEAAAAALEALSTRG